MSGSALRTLYWYSLYFVGLFVAVELVLEYRHYQKGFTTSFFGKKVKLQQQKLQLIKNSAFGPSEYFPFKSRVITETKTKKTRLWIASASHAEGGRIIAENVFPSLICAKALWNEGCESINGSKAGMSIEKNILFLKKHASYQPDYAILYQLSMVIGGQQKRLSKSTSASKTNQPILDFTPASRFFQKLALYGHLSDFIGGFIKLSGQQKDSLPSEMNDDFKQQVLGFISYCRTVNIEPVIMTFAASHSSTNMHEMPFSKQLNFVKYNNYLSPQGWINMVSLYNGLLRKIAVDENIPLIDLEKILNGKTDKFIDFVHFNEAGHHVVANYIATEMTRIKLKKELKNDF